MAVHRVIGGVEIEHDLLGRGGVRLAEQVDEQGFDRRRIVADLVVTAQYQGRVREPVEGALAGQRAQSWRRAASLPARAASTGS